MRREMKISKPGIKLIKAYEGFRPVDRHLVNGQHVVGYGHIIDDGGSVVLTKLDAETLLRRDLEPYEDMINTMVHAPLTQNQYDALVSLAFNIGPRAFIESDTIRALNNGRPLDAANSFDIWRKSTINGKSYVVDALMRRRSAEKALFLRADDNKILRASRADLPPLRDEMVAMLKTEDALPVISNEPSNGFVARVPYSTDEFSGEDLSASAPQTSDRDLANEASYEALNIAQGNPSESQNGLAKTDEKSQGAAGAAMPLRRREDGSSGILELCEVYDGDEDDTGHEDDNEDEHEDDDFESEYGRSEYPEDIDDLVDSTYEIDDSVPRPPESTKPSLIAETASKLSKRLDALIDNVKGDARARAQADESVKDWPESLISPDPSSALRTSDSSASDISDLNVEPNQLPADDMFSPTQAAYDPEFDINTTADLGDQVVEMDVDHFTDAESAGNAQPELETPAPNVVIDNLVEDDAFRVRSDSASKYIGVNPPVTPEPKASGRGYFIPLLTGMCLMGASAGAFFGNPTALLGEWGPLLSFIGLIVGFIMSVFTIYYALKSKH